MESFAENKIAPLAINLAVPASFNSSAVLAAPSRDRPEHS